MKNRIRLLMSIFLVAGTLLSVDQATIADSKHLRRLANQIGPQDAILIKTGNRILLAKHAQKLRIPASVLKLLTGLGAIHYLGADYRFKTEFYSTPSNKILKIKGYGDPLWISEVLAQAAADFKNRLTTLPGHSYLSKGFSGLILDDGYFSQPVSIPGRSRTPQPYDAPNSALCANFNTVHLALDKQNRPISGEPQTPLVQFALAHLTKNGLQPGRSVLSHEESQATLYSGHLLAYFLKENEIPLNGPIQRGPVRPQNDKLLMRFSSPFPLTEVINKLMIYSNNFVANQLLLAMGAKVYGPPATLEKGVQALSRFARTDLGLRGFEIAEGSGISRKNRLTATQIMTLLEAYSQRKELLRKKGRQWFKTGTLKDVQTRAGYYESASGTTYGFVILINTPQKDIAPLMDLLQTALDEAS